MIDFIINTTKENKADVLDKIKHLGSVDENWPDGTFNFMLKDENVDELTEILDELNIKYELI